MDGANMQIQETTEFSHPMTMYQPYASYQAYQTQSCNSISNNTTTTFTSTAPLSSLTTSSPIESYYGSKYSAAVQMQEEEEEEPVSFAPKKPLPRKQTRNQYTKEQKSALENSYLNGAYVSIRRREEMANELKLSTKQVKVWYQNRRQKDKRRELKLKKVIEQTKQVIKVPPSAESPDSGVQDVFNESNYQRHFIKMEKYSHDKYHYKEQEDHQQQLPQQQQVMIATYHDPETNKVDPVVKSEVTLSTNTMNNYDGKYYTPASGPLATSTPTSATHYSPYDFSQAFANYYNYDYLQQYQYYQLMSGYQSHYSAQDPQEPQTYSGY